MRPYPEHRDPRKHSDSGIGDNLGGRSPRDPSGNHQRVGTHRVHGQPKQAREAECFDTSGKRCLRTGGVGHFADGFLTLMDRKKEMVVGCSFNNIHPSDLEAVLQRAAAMTNAFRRAGTSVSEVEPVQWLIARVGNSQRLIALQLIDDLPRRAFGKVLKRESPERFDSLLR
jgi:hypothetical protein